MKPVKFTEHNDVIFFQNKPVYSRKQSTIQDGRTHEWSISKWRANFWDRIRILFTGEVWALRTDKITVLTTIKEDLL